MSGRGRYARWALLVLAVMLGLFGLGDVIVGPPADPGITLGLSGLTLAELRAESAAGYRMLDLYTRGGGLLLMAMSIGLVAVLLIPYRAGHRWAWFTMWVLPAWALAVFVLYTAFGVAAGQAPPPPMISSPIAAAIGAVALLVDRDRFIVPVSRRTAEALPRPT